MPTLYSKKWTDKNGTVRYYKDEEARNDIITLKANSSTQGSVDYKISQALSNYVENDDYASTSTAGVVKVDGTTITINNNGVISGASQVDTATNSSLGVVKGDGVSTNVDSNGLLTAIKVNGHTVAKDVPSNAVFTDTTALGSMTGTLAVEHGGTGATSAANARTNLGLGNVGNFKAVSTVASQGLTDTEKSNARANIGAGTSSFSGDYNDLMNNPTLGTAAAKDFTDSTSPSAISTRPSLVTERDIYYGLPIINNSHAYTSSTSIYAPTSGGTSGANYYLRGNGTTSAPIWQTAATSATSGSNTLITSGAVYTALNGIITSTTTDPGEGSTLATGHLLVVLEQE